MIYFLGNCQTGFLCEAARALGLPATSRFLPSPMTYLKGNGRIPAELARMVDEHGAADFLHDRHLENQFSIMREDDAAPSLFVFNLFHENDPLFAHTREGYVFFVDPAAWDHRPGFERWMKANFQLIRLNPESYLQRYSAMLETFRNRHPGVPILLLTRLSHFPAFGPSPYSYLKGWGSLWNTIAPQFFEWAAALPDCHILDLNRILAGLMQEGEGSIEAHCPFMRITTGRTGNGPVTLSFERDVEHIGTMWPRLAERVADFVDAGVVRYADHERIPPNWGVPSEPETLCEEKMRKLLASGSNYNCARAVAAFFRDLSRDHTPLLTEHAGSIPVCHNTLHMIRRYGELFPTASFRNFCRVHSKRAATFTANGPAYRQKYLETLIKLERPQVTKTNIQKP